MNATTASPIAAVDSAAEASIANVDLELLPPNGYRALCIANLVLCSISVILCAVLITAVTLPLLYPKRRKKYSTYNLYLAYMAIPDLVANIFIVYLLLAYNNSFWIHDDINYNYDNENPIWMFEHPLDHNIFVLCVAGNLYVNAFLSYEMYWLLKHSNMRKRHRPPTISRVTKQAMISYGVGMLAFFIEFWISKAEKGENWQHKQWRSHMYTVFNIVYTGVIPLSALLVVCAMIYKQGLIKSTDSMYEGRLKVLIVFFARIVFISIVFWLPAIIIYTISWTQNYRTHHEVTSIKILAYNTTFLFSGSQSIASFGFCLTKPDTRKLIFDLMKCDYCLRCGVKGDNDDNDKCDYDDPFLRSFYPRTRRLSSILFTSRNFGSIFSSIHRSSGQKQESTIEIQSSASHKEQHQNVGRNDDAFDSPDLQNESSTRNSVSNDTSYSPDSLDLQSETHTKHSVSNDASDSLDLQSQSSTQKPLSEEV